MSCLNSKEENLLDDFFSADLADLIFVFFDPIGQALCKRTLNLVEKINEKHAERMRCVEGYIFYFLLSNAAPP